MKTERTKQDGPEARIYWSLWASIVFASVLVIFTSGCGLTASPAVEHRPEISNYPTLGVRFASDETVQPAFPPKPGTHWSRNWGWYAAVAGLLATDALTDGDVVGIFRGSGSSDDHHINVSEIDGGPVAAARGESTITIENAPTCDFNFVAEEGSEISCSALVPDDEE